MCSVTFSTTFGITVTNTSMETVQQSTDFLNKFVVFV